VGAGRTRLHGGDPAKTATLAGVLNVSLINGFVPLPGDTFMVMTYASRTGTFLDKLPVGPGADETCVVPSTTGTTGSDSGTPVLGKGFFYLVRETVIGCGVGTYGFRTAGTERISTACP
jgi:hypothetical protein